MTEWKEPEPFYSREVEKAERQIQQIRQEDIRKEFVESIGHGECGPSTEVQFTTDENGNSWAICLGCEQGWPFPEITNEMFESGVLGKRK